MQLNSVEHDAIRKDNAINAQRIVLPHPQSIAHNRVLPGPLLLTEQFLGRDDYLQETGSARSAQFSFAGVQHVWILQFESAGLVQPEVPVVPEALCVEETEAQCSLQLPHWWGEETLHILSPTTRVVTTR